jgi:hypothetical protein
MNRDDLIKRLVIRKMAANGQAGAFCVPCLASPAKAYCECLPAPGRKLCIAPPKHPAADPKN